ncbi:MAG: DNA primase [Alphaproteobacteria bacterium]|nr:DNA primase [Alphaproteobacteria bacterium]
MASFTPAFLATLRQRLQLSTVVGRRVKLVKKGREYSGHCPFHTEKSPSFTVNDDKEFFHCFGCGEHGDVIGFVMRTEGLSFPEAVEKLAQEAGLELPKSDFHNREEGQKLARLKQLTAMAAKWFSTQLATPSGAEARDYLSRRGITEAMRQRFKLGFAPGGAGYREQLKDSLLKQGFSTAEIIEAGLAIEPSEGGQATDSYDRFRHRLIFPIHNGRGEVIGFGGRALGEAIPKYLNSPDTPLFSKGSQLYGYDLARAHGKRSPAIVVEGYLDVIALHQAGFVTAVAPLGTALTEAQLNLLWRMSPEPLLCFDGDNAGQKAANRAAFRALELLEPGRSLRFVTLPNGKDPDDLIHSLEGIAVFRQCLERAEPLYLRLFKAELQASPIVTPEQKADLIKRLRGRAQDIVNPDIRKFYQSEFADLLQQQFPNRAAANQNNPKGNRFNRFTVITNSSKAFFDRNPWRKPARRFDPYLSEYPFEREVPQESLQQLRHDLALLYTPLIGLMVKFPSIAAKNLEVISILTIPDTRLDTLRKTIVEVIALNPECDVYQFELALSDRNQGEQLKEIFAFNVTQGIMIALLLQARVPDQQFARLDIEGAEKVSRLLLSEIQISKDRIQRQDWVKRASAETAQEIWNKIKASYEKSAVSLVEEAENSQPESPPDAGDESEKQPTATEKKGQG